MKHLLYSSPTSSTPYNIEYCYLIWKMAYTYSIVKYRYQSAKSFIFYYINLQIIFLNRKLQEDWPLYLDDKNLFEVTIIYNKAGERSTYSTKWNRSSTSMGASYWYEIFNLLHMQKGMDHWSSSITINQKEIIVKLVLTGGPPSQNSITPRPITLPCYRGIL